MQFYFIVIEVNQTKGVHIIKVGVNINELGPLFKL